MTLDEVDTLVAHVTRVRHRGGAEGLYLGCYITGGLWLVVENGTGRHNWAAGDCEVAS